MSTAERRRAGPRHDPVSGGAAAMARPRADTLTVTGQPHGPDLRAPDDRRDRAGDGPQADQDRRRLRVDGLRPRLHEHRLLPQRDHLHRRRGRDPPAPRLPDRAAVRAVQLPGGRLPDHQRHAADADPARGLGRGDHDPHVRAREREGLHAGLPLRRQPDGHARRLGGGPVDLLPRCQPDPRRGVRAIQIIRLLAKMPTLAAFAFRHNMGQPYVYPDNDLQLRRATSWG